MDIPGLFRHCGGRTPGPRARLGVGPQRRQAPLQGLGCARRGDCGDHRRHGIRRFGPGGRDPAAGIHLRGIHPVGRSKSRWAEGFLHSAGGGELQLRRNGFPQGRRLLILRRGEGSEQRRAPSYGRLRYNGKHLAAAHTHAHTHAHAKSGSHPHTYSYGVTHPGTLANPRAYRNTIAPAVAYSRAHRDAIAPAVAYSRATATPSPLPSPTPEPTATPSPLPSPTPEPTATPSPTATASPPPHRLQRQASARPQNRLLNRPYSPFNPRPRRPRRACLWTGVRCLPGLYC